MNIAVYCGSNSGYDSIYMEKAVKLGRWIAKQGHTLVYGGSNCGIMGTVADAALEAGGKVIGITVNIPRILANRHTGVTKSTVAEDLPARRKEMLEISDVYIAFPGGPGTIDEITEIIAMLKIGVLDKPAIFYDINGFWEPFRDLLHKMSAEGFCSNAEIRNVYYADSLEEIAELIKKGG